MTKTLTRLEGASVLVIEQPILDLLNIRDNTPLKVSVDGRRLIIEPAGDPDRAKKFADAVAEADKEYGHMFKKLAQ